jgi:hypothetical protein
MSKRVIKQLSDMAIDEVSLVDRGANQHALISIAKNLDVDDIFAKARGVPTDESIWTSTTATTRLASWTSTSSTTVRATSAPARPSPGTQKTSAQDVTGKAGKAKTKAATTFDDKGAKKVEETSSKGEKNLPAGLSKRADDFDDVILAKALGLVVDDYEFEKNFGPQQPMPFQQQGQAPQFGNPPAAQSVGAMPFGQGAPQQPQVGPNPQNPGMPSGGPQVPGPTAQPGMPGAQPGMPGAQPGMPGAQPQGLAGLMTQQGAPPALNVSQLPPEVIQYIQQLEKQVAQSQGSNNSDSSSEGSDSSNDSTDSDNSNKPFGKSGAFNMNEDIFLDELSKAIRDEDGRAEFSKALQARFDAYESEISKAQELAASERDLRLEREFIAKAAEFSVPVAADELGPVLKRAAENLSSEDFSVIVKCLDAATELSQDVFGEVGKRGTGANVDIFDAVEAEAGEIAKSRNISREQAAAEVFAANPQAYDQYRQSHPGFRF